MTDRPDPIEAQYEALAEAIPHIVFLADPDGRVVYYNKLHDDYTGTRDGMDSDELERAVIHPDDFDECQRRWEASIRSGQLYEIEYRLLRVDGVYRWHLGRALPVRDASGRILKWFGTCTDIHDQKRAEEQVRILNAELEERVAERTRELEMSNADLATEILERKRLEDKEHAHLERLKRMVDILPLGALITDEEHSILHVNERFCALFDIRLHPSFLIGKSTDEVMMLAKKASADPPYYLRRLQNALSSSEAKLEEEIQMMNGRILLRDYLPIVVHGQPRGHVFLYRDVTQERRVDAAKSEFMSLASHQLRTPLTSVRWAIGRLSKLLKDRSGEEEARLFGTARAAVTHMSKSIDTMLMISRIEAGKVTVKRAEVLLCPILQGAVKQEQEQIDAKKLSVSVHCEEEAGAHCDESILREIVTNLVSNAVKYTPDGGMILVRCARQAGSVHIDVQDNGYGIPTHQQRKIFSKFFRGDNILRMHTDGTGLGLYLAYRLADLLDGSLSFVSEENRGTTFTLVLPER